MAKESGLIYLIVSLGLLLLGLASHTIVFQIIKEKVLKEYHKFDHNDSEAALRQFLREEGIQASDQQIKLALEEAASIVKTRTTSDMVNSAHGVVTFLQSLQGSGTLHASTYKIQQASDEASVKTTFSTFMTTS